MENEKKLIIGNGKRKNGEKIEEKRRKKGERGKGEELKRKEDEKDKWRGENKVRKEGGGRGTDRKIEEERERTRG